MWATSTTVCKTIVAQYRNKIVEIVFDQKITFDRGENGENKMANFMFLFLVKFHEMNLFSFIFVFIFVRVEIERPNWSFAK